MKLKLKSTALLLLVTILSFGQIVKNQEWEFTNTVTLSGDVVIPAGASSGSVLTSDGSGNATWQSSGGSIQSATVTLSPSDILSMHSNPITLIPAQGANTFISVLSVVAFLDFNSVPYSVDPTYRVEYDNGSGIIQNSNALSYSADYLARNYTSTISTSGSITIINSAVRITTPTSNPTLGDSPLKVTILYTVINL